MSSSARSSSPSSSGSARPCSPASCPPGGRRASPRSPPSATRPSTRRAPRSAGSIGGVIVLAALGVATVVHRHERPTRRSGRPGSERWLTLVGAVILGPVVARPAAGVLGLGAAPPPRPDRPPRPPQRDARPAPHRRQRLGTDGRHRRGRAVHHVRCVDQGDRSRTRSTRTSAATSSSSPTTSAAPASAPRSPRRSPSCPRSPWRPGCRSASSPPTAATIDPAVVDPAALGALLDLGVSEGSLDDVTAGQHRGQRAVRRRSRPRDRQHCRRRRSPTGSTELDGRRHLRVHDQNVGDMVMTPDDWAPHADQARRRGRARRSRRRRVGGRRPGRRQRGDRAELGTRRADPVGVHRQHRVRRSTRCCSSCTACSALAVRDRPDGHRQHAVACRSTNAPGNSACCGRSDRPAARFARPCAGSR